MELGAIFGGLNAFLRGLKAIVPGQVLIHRKSSDDTEVLFWVVHEPKYPGQPLWVEVTVGEKKRGRISIFWPTKSHDLPFGIEGDEKTSSYCPMYGADHVEELVLQGQTRYMLGETEKSDVLARSKWKGSSHVRACFRIMKLKKKPLLGDWIKIQILDTSRKVQAISFIRVDAI